MTVKNVEDPSVGATDPTSDSESLLDEDLQDVSGGGTFGDIYDALNESWTDIKKGFVDAWND